MELLIPLLLVLIGVMALTARRQKKLQAQTQQMQDSLTVGDRVQTTSGVYGTVTGVADGVIDLELAEGHVTRWNRLAIREVVHADDVAASFPGAPTPSLDDDVEQPADEAARPDDAVSLDKDAERER